MSNKYKHGDIIPDDIICNRLHELAIAVTEGTASINREFTMRVPAELDRDADLVLSEAANRIKELNESIRTAIANFEASEKPFYDGIKELKEIHIKGT